MCFDGRPITIVCFDGRPITFVLRVFIHDEEQMQCQCQTREVPRPVPVGKVSHRDPFRNGRGFYYYTSRLVLSTIRVVFISVII